MRLKSFLLAAAFAVSAVPAIATPSPSLSMRLTDGTTTVILPTASCPGGDICMITPNVITFIGPVGAFNINVTTGENLQGLGVTTLPGIDLNSIDNSTGTGTLSLLLTETNIISADPVTGIVSQIGGTLNDATVHYTTWFDANNNPFGENTLLANQMFTSSPFAVSETDYVSTSGLFSITEQITLTATGKSVSSFDAQMSVPEPASLALLGTGLLGLGMIRRRRT